MIQTVMIVLFLTTALADENNECGINESISLCGKMCEPSCERPSPNQLSCPKIQCSQFTSGCRCNEQYLRNKNGSCVLLHNCDD